MLNKLRQFISRYRMLQAGDAVVCAVSGGADSVALLFGLYLLREKLQIDLSAAHFNHRLRGEESDRDEAFVREFCDRLDIPLAVGSGDIVAGKKGLEAAARDARYNFFETLPGIIATAHTANDNLETVLMHLVRGTGLKGLGGIAPINGKLIRPMLEITREEVLTFLDEYHLSYVTDSTNEQDLFFRNRLRHRIIPLLENENPSLALNVTALAQRLRQDEMTLQNLASAGDASDVRFLRSLEPSLCSRAIRVFLQNSGVQEPESRHISLVESLLFSDKPSASIRLKDDVVIARNYNALVAERESEKLESIVMNVPGETFVPQLSLRVIARPATEMVDFKDKFTIVPEGKLILRHRLPGDRMRLHGGSKDLKKLFIDMKIPKTERLRIPVIADDKGIVALHGVGVNRDRLCVGASAIEIHFVCEEKKEEEHK